MPSLSSQWEELFPRFDRAGWISAGCVLVALLIWWRLAKSWPLWISFWTASLFALAYTMMTCLAFISARTLLETDGVIPRGTRNLQVYQMTSGLVRAHQATAIPLACALVIGVALTLFVHRSRRSTLIVEDKDPRMPLFGRVTLGFAVLAAALLAIVVGRLRPLGDVAEGLDMGWIDLDDRIRHHGKLDLDAIPMGAGTPIGMGRACADLAGNLAEEDIKVLYPSGRFRRSAPQIDRDALATMCADAALDSRDGFDDAGRRTLAMLACSNQSIDGGIGLRRHLSAAARLRFDEVICTWRSNE